jgi:hypothetical protein
MARKQTLKVFRTAIGFHDAYVAAPSQKAALEAWGSDADLFARGMAERVTDEELTREPLAHPGQVIKRSRGSAAQQLAALSPDPPEATPKSAGGQPRAAKRKTTKTSPRLAPPQPRPSRKALDEAERRLDALAGRRKDQLDKLRQREQALAQERRELERAHEHAVEAAERKVESERAAHAEAVGEWLKTQKEET